MLHRIWLLINAVTAMFETMLGFVIVLTVIVTVHEFGHFWVARRLGVKVLRFSIGFGTPLYSWKSAAGTEFTLAAIPLGGYVKMLDEREGEVAQEELHLAFNRKSVFARMAIVAAGPVANLILAWLIYWAIFVLGVQSIKPLIGDVMAGTLAEQAGVIAGSEIIAVDDVATLTWQDVNIRMLSRMGESGTLTLTVTSPQSDASEHIRIPINNWLKGMQEPDPLLALGISVYRPTIPALLGDITPDGAAAAAGMRSGDRVVAVNESPVTGWQHWVELVRQHAGKAMQVEIMRDGAVLRLSVTPQVKLDEGGQAIGYLGVAVAPFVWPEELVREIRYSWWSAWRPAMQKVGVMVALTADSVKKMVQGLVSVDQLGGPITIAKTAGSSLSSGITALLGFIAYFSISLGILNLLPIPILDGGHLLYFSIEAIRGKALSEHTQAIGLRIGLAILAALMLVALYNDLKQL